MFVPGGGTYGKLNRCTGISSEAEMQQLQERLQMNLIQQTHLVSQQSPTDVKTSDTLHQMAFQQQQLVHHLQMTQRRYVLQHGMNLPPSAMPPAPQQSKSNNG